MEEEEEEAILPKCLIREKDKEENAPFVLSSRMKQKEGILVFDWAKIIFLGSSIRSHVPIFFLKTYREDNNGS